VTVQEVCRSADAFGRGDGATAESADFAERVAAVAALVERWGGAGEVARRAVALYGLVGEAADGELADEVLSRLAVGPNSDVPRSPGGGERAVGAHPDDDEDGLGGEPAGRHPAERSAGLPQRHVRDAGGHGDQDRHQAQQR
jgi:hypothetical protein